LSRAREKPDRVYGLRRTNKLQRLLLCTNNRCEGKLIGDVVKTSPFLADGDPVLFPFLVLEAKSDKSADSFKDIEVQTAFSIRELLRLQDDLYQAANGTRDEAHMRPFVWFISYRGEQWRVSAAFVEKKKGVCHYVSPSLSPIWRGDS
jgi:hypothetical protein